MKINMVSSVNMCNNKQYNKSQPAFGKFSVEMDIPSPQELAKVLERKEFSNLVNAADKEGFDIVLRRSKETNSKYTLIAREQEVKPGECTSVKLLGSEYLDAFSYPIALDTALMVWNNFVQSTLKKRAQVDTLVGQFNERLGLK